MAAISYALLNQKRTKGSAFFTELRFRRQKSERQSREDEDIQNKGWKEAKPREFGVASFA